MWVYVAMVIMLGIVIWNIERQQNRDHVYVGNIGEGIVAVKLSALGEEYIVEHNVHMGGVQIDHLVINHELKICFVIETKLWGGVISGKSSDDYWVQNKNGETKYFRNPVKQNAHHCNIVRRYYSGYKVYNVVVFVRGNAPKSRCIVSVNGLADYIIKTSNKVSNRGVIDIETDKLSYRV